MNDQNIINIDINASKSAETSFKYLAKESGNNSKSLALN